MGILLARLTTNGSVLSSFLLAEGLPEDWDYEEDGEWTAPTIINLEYKGPWNQKKIKNPSYPGKWKAHMITNPGFPLLLIKIPQEIQDEEDPHKVKWTKVFRNLRGKDMTQDSMLEFKRKRNIPDSMIIDDVSIVKTLERASYRQEAATAPSRNTARATSSRHVMQASVSSSSRGTPRGRRLPGTRCEKCIVHFTARVPSRNSAWRPRNSAWRRTRSWR